MFSSKRNPSHFFIITVDGPLKEVIISTKQNLSWRLTENKCLMQIENGLKDSKTEDIRMKSVTIKMEGTVNRKVLSMEGPNVISSTQKHDKNKTIRKSLKSFKYQFNNKGHLRHIDTRKPFEFNISNNRKQNQKNYEELGEAVTEHIYDLLQTELKLEKVYVPLDQTDNEPQSFIFQSEDALSNPHKLLLLVHGTGAVCAGQWARRLIINDCLDTGSQIPFIKRAVQSGFAVLVLNTNLNKSRETGNKIRGNGNALDHLLYVWDNFVVPAEAKHVAFISHSYGGVATVKLANQRRDFLSRISAVAFTDSMPDSYITDANMKEFFKKKSLNWVASKATLDTVVKSFSCTVPKVSAGHTKHEMTSSSSINSIFKYLNEKIPDNSKVEL